MSIVTTLSTLPPATRALTALTLSLSGILFIFRLSLSSGEIKQVFGASNDSSLAFGWLVLIPGNVIWYPWTLLTSAFVETNIIELAVSVLTLPLAGRYLERVWGARDFLIFVGVVVVASNIISVFVSILEAVVLGDKGAWMYGIEYHGLMALQVAFLVAFTQLIPEHQVQIFGGLATVRVKRLPMMYVTVSNVACLIGYQSPYILIQFGWLVSWVYLRFFKTYDTSSSSSTTPVYVRGDRSETFAFASWFPPVAHIVVVPLSNFVFNLAVKFKVVQPWTNTASSVGGGDIESGAFGGGNRAEAERRRAMALKALDQRLASSTSGSSAPVASGSGAGPIGDVKSSPTLKKDGSPVIALKELGTKET